MTNAKNVACPHNIDLRAVPSLDYIDSRARLGKELSRVTVFVPVENGGLVLGLHVKRLKLNIGLRGCIR